MSQSPTKDILDFLSLPVLNNVSSGNINNNPTLSPIPSVSPSAYELSEATNTNNFKKTNTNVNDLATDSIFISLKSSLSQIQSDLTAELTPEFAVKKVDIGSVKDICKHWLNQYIKATELINNSTTVNSNSSDFDLETDSLQLVPDSVLVSTPLFPPNLRAKIWKHLLGCHNKDDQIIENWERLHNKSNENNESTDPDIKALEAKSAVESPKYSDDTLVMGRAGAKAGLETESALDELSLIQQDVQRTRPNDSRLDPLRPQLEQLLVFYCRSRGVAYKQGLNEILAPILVCLTEGRENKGTVYNCFYSLISKFLPSIFNDSEFESLRCIFGCFRLLLMYHDPSLCLSMDSISILPELYSTSWFITLFAKDLQLDLLLLLWDVYLTEDDPFFHYFIALALLIQNRASLLNLEQSLLPMALRTLHVQNITNLIKNARILRSKTPLAFRQQLHEISFKSTMTNSQLDQLSNYMNTLPCLTIPTLDLVNQAFNQSNSGIDSGQTKYILLDIRDSRQFNAGHLPLAINLSPSVIFFADKIEELMNTYKQMKGCHFCIIGNNCRTFATCLKEAETQVEASSKNSNNSTSLTTVFMNVLQSGQFNANQIPNNFLLGAELLDLEAEETKQPLSASRKSFSSSQTMPNSNSMLYSFPSINPLLDPYTSSFVSLFLSYGFTHISVCEGGYSAAHSLVIKSKATELVDHNSKICSCCNLNYFTQWRDEIEKKKVKAEKERAKAEALAAKAEKERLEKLEKEKKEAALAEANSLQISADSNKDKDANDEATSATKKTESLKDKFSSGFAKFGSIWGKKKDSLSNTTSPPIATTPATSTSLSPSASSPIVANTATATGDGSLTIEKPNTILASPPAADKSAEPVKSPNADNVKSSKEETEKPKAKQTTLKDLFFGEKAFFSSSKSAKDEKPVEKPKEESNVTIATDKKEEKHEEHSNTPPPAASSSNSDSAVEKKATETSEKSKETSLKEKTEDLKRAMKSLFSFGDSNKNKAKQVRGPTETETAIDLRSWLTVEADIALFACHEVKRVPNSTQGILIPRVLAISAGYIIDLRPDQRELPVAPSETQEPIIGEKSKHTAKESENKNNVNNTENGPNENNNTDSKLTVSPTASDEPVFSIGLPNSPTDIIHEDSAASLTGSQANSRVSSVNIILNANSPKNTEDSNESTTSNNNSDTKSSELVSVPLPETVHTKLDETKPKQNLNPLNEAFQLIGSGYGYIKRKRKITDLDRITSKKERPCLLTFHWKENNIEQLSPANSSSPTNTSTNPEGKNTTIYMIDRPKECIGIVRQKYLLAKQALRAQTPKKQNKTPINNTTDSIASIKEGENETKHSTQNSDLQSTQSPVLNPITSAQSNQIAMEIADSNSIEDELDSIPPPTRSSQSNITSSTNAVNNSNNSPKVIHATANLIDLLSDDTITASPIKPENNTNIAADLNDSNISATQTATSNGDNFDSLLEQMLSDENLTVDNNSGTTNNIDLVGNVELDDFEAEMNRIAAEAEAESKAALDRSLLNQSNNSLP